MRTLTWTKRSAGRWTLKDEFGNIWAAVVPYSSEHACKNQYKGALLAGCPRFHGRVNWTTGIGVAAAKRHAENLLDRVRCALDNFVIAS